MTTKLAQLKEMTVVVADTGDIEAIKRFQPIDATTNPSLLLKAAQIPEYAALIAKSVKDSAGFQHHNRAQQLSDISDRFGVLVGKQILEIVPGLVSTEVDARLSFNVNGTLEKARKLIHLYEELGICRDRILIKVASTWEGIQAAKQLELEGIHCNLTLLFSFAQAIACAEANATLISPFVGRILDWYKANTGTDAYPPAQDPGVISVTRIFNYYKTHGYKTIVMGASFRNLGEIEQLAGCDKLTISPQLMAELDQDESHLPQILKPTTTSDSEPKCSLDEKTFRWELNQDAMATEKLAQGIRSFTEDQIKLETLIAEQL